MTYSRKNNPHVRETWSHARRWLYKNCFSLCLLLVFQLFFPTGTIFFNHESIFPLWFNVVFWRHYHVLCFPKDFVTIVTREMLQNFDTKHVDTDQLNSSQHRLYIQHCITLSLVTWIWVYSEICKTVRNLHFDRGQRLPLTYKIQVKHVHLS